MATVAPRLMKPLSQIRVAVVHEWLVRYVGGAERVVANIHSAFPDADHFALMHDPQGFRGSPLEKLVVQTSFIQSLPASTRNYQRYLPLMPLAVEQFDLSDYDVVISLSHAVAKGVITSPDQLHICYLQARNLKYAYEDRFFYPRNRISGFVQDYFLSRIRVWDGIASQRPDVTIANSHFVSDWHRHRHGVDSLVIYPPVDTTHFFDHFQTVKDDYYVTVGRLEPYKRLDLVVKAFNSLGARLVVIGDGSMMASLKRMARNPAIEFLGHQDSATVARLIARAKAFVFASREDFGIAPLEAQACGTPVIAYGRGGASETIVGSPASGVTGLFFDSQTPEAVQEAVETFDARKESFDPEVCRRNAERFGEGRFQREFGATVAQLWDEFRNGRADYGISQHG